VPTPESAAGDAWTVGRIIDWTTAHLRRHGSDTPRLDAEILLAHARGTSRIQLYVDYGVPLSEKERGTMRDLVRRRAQAEPVAYLVGYREFLGLKFEVSPQVLVPRPETETLVLELLAATRRTGLDDGDAIPASLPSNPGAHGLLPIATTPETDPSPEPWSPRILDVGTGSGCIAVAVATHLRHARITAIDLSPVALTLARRNAALHGVENRVRFLEGDLFAPLAANERFDFIVSNPPYVPAGEIAELPPDVRLHEPHLALAAGADGLDVIRRLIADAPGRLVARGGLFIEISPEQATEVSRLFAAAGRFDSIETRKDAAGTHRVVMGRRVD
jgi:release factor glutamine methyltransferase